MFFCVAIINTHSGQSASAPLTSVLWYSRIFFFCAYCLKQTQTSRAPQYPRQTPELKEYWSAKYLHGWSSWFSHGNIWSKNSADGESDADLKCKLCFCFAGRLRCHNGNASRKTKEVGKKKKKKDSEPVKSSLVVVKYVFLCVNVKNITFRSLICIYRRQHGRISLFQNANQHNF